MTPKNGRWGPNSAAHSPTHRRLFSHAKLAWQAPVVCSLSLGEASPQLSPSNEDLLSNLGQSLTASTRMSFSSAASRAASPAGSNSELLGSIGRGGTSSRPPSRARSEGLLVGVSSTAEYLNGKQNRSFNKLVQGHSRGRKFQAAMNRSDHSSLPPGARGAELDEQDFIRSTDRLVNSISDLRSRHEAFEAMGSPMSRRRKSGAGIGHGEKDMTGPSRDEEEKAEQLAERLQAYKLVRRVDPDVPQLPPLSSLPPLQKEPVHDEIIKRNCSSSTIQCSSPEMRKVIIANRSTALCERTNMAATMREESLTSMRMQITESLLRKKMQGERVTQAKHEVAVAKAAASRQDMCLEGQWCTIAILATSIKHLAEEVKVSRMGPEERMRYCERLRLGKSTNKIRKVSQFVQQAIFLSDVLADEKKCWRLGLITAMVRSRMQVCEARTRARAMFECLSSWQVAGRCFTAFKALCNRIVQLQRWWRETLKSLHEVRDQIARRWERLERSALVQELNRAPPMQHVAGRSNKAASPQPKLTLEDRIEGERVEESVRTRFIENELRIRRYRMLPQVLMWEEEVERWQANYQEWQDTKDAHRALGKEAPPLTIFHWPPVRPSYLPKAHPMREANGYPCHECCLGRQGDEEILNMWRAARRNPNLWSLTPMPTGAVLKHSSKAGRRRSGGDAQQMERVACPFGEAEEQELQSWGVGASMMPSLAINAEGVDPPC